MSAVFFYFSGRPGGKSRRRLFRTSAFASFLRYALLRFGTASQVLHSLTQNHPFLDKFKFFSRTIKKKELSAENAKNDAAKKRIKALPKASSELWAAAIDDNEAEAKRLIAAGENPDKKRKNRPYPGKKT